MTRLRRHESIAVNCDDELLDLRDAEVVALRRRVRELEAENTNMRQLLRRSLQLPRPWMDGGITWENWDSIFTDIEAELARDGK